MPPSGRVEKRMRKGTRSCIECRKRKVKCIFGSDNERCLTCTARGTKCMTQTKVLGPDPIPASISAISIPKDISLEERVVQLEALLISQGSRDGSQSTPRVASISHGSPRSFQDSAVQQSNLDSGCQNTINENPFDLQAGEGTRTDPFGSIFNNAIWRQKGTNAAVSDRISGHQDGAIASGHRNRTLPKDSGVCDELCRSLPPPRLIAEIVKASCSWWDTWRAVGGWLKDRMSQSNLCTLHETLNWALASSQPPVAALGVLCFAICIQQLDLSTHESIMRQLPRPPGELFQDYFDRIHRLVINDNGYSSTESGIELLLLTAKTYMNLGLLKNAWLLQHRAVAHAQLLGLHRLQRKNIEETDAEMKNRHALWFQICERDLYMSLLLGLPYAANWQTLLPNLHGEEGTLRYFQYQMIRLSAQILDRNQMGLETSVSHTRTVEDDMNSTANEMPQDFWDSTAALQRGDITREMFSSQIASQFWFFQAKVLLHQPLMIQSIEDRQLLYHRDACLTASRNTLRLYHLMRSESGSVFSMVKLVDYQAFVCSAILLLGILGYGSSSPPALSITIENGNDFAIVEQTIEILRKASLVSNNTMASQAVQGLDSLAMLVRYSTNKDMGKICTLRKEASVPYMKITVPGSGVITISPGKLMLSDSCTSADATAPPTASFEPPTFYFSHASFDTSSHEGSEAVPQQDSIGGQALDMDISMMDLDWNNMFGTDFDNDWAWLADINAAGMM